MDSEMMNPFPKETINLDIQKRDGLKVQNRRLNERNGELRAENDALKKAFKSYISSHVSDQNRIDEIFDYYLKQQEGKK